MTVRDDSTLECNAAPCSATYTSAGAPDAETLRLQAAAGLGWHSVRVDLGDTFGSVLIDLCEQHCGIFDQAWRYLSVQDPPIRIPPIRQKGLTP